MEGPGGLRGPCFRVRNIDPATPLALDRGYGHEVADARTGVAVIVLSDIRLGEIFDGSNFKQHKHVIESLAGRDSLGGIET